MHGGGRQESTKLHCSPSSILTNPSLHLTCGKLIGSTELTLPCDCKEGGIIVETQGGTGNTMLWLA